MLDMFKSGGPIMYPLLLCSIIAMAIIVDRSFFWILTGMRRNRELVNDVLDLCRKGDWDAVRARSAGSNNYVVRVLISGILHREYSLTKAMESAAAEEIKRMSRYMGVLDTIITVAPLLGILGTVTGIIKSFEVLGAGGLDNPQSVTGGIAEALITTAAGLSIAIPSVFFYNYFNSCIQRAGQIIEKYATSFEIVYEKVVMASEGNKGNKE
ncbi:MAG: MotA/TolQ/ExbB proton channel family protein [Pseudomonadota bacterium]